MQAIKQGFSRRVLKSVRKRGVAAQQELFDDAILRILDRNRSRLGLGIEAIRHQIALGKAAISSFKHFL